MPEFQTVCNVGDIPAGESRMFVVNETMLALFNRGSEFFALNDVCPHAGASLARGYVEDDVVYCRIHHWGFCLRDGKSVDQPGSEYAAKSYPVRVVDGKVEVEVE